MKEILWIMILTPLFTMAQETKGIQFVHELKWFQILDKAKKENKYIFLDCFATWCAPCKLMDRDVYSKHEVGDFVNENFISIKVQMDTSKMDDEYVKAWYQDAYDIQQQYKVSSFPTYLFFSPEGKIVHRYVSAMPDSLFLKVAANALNPDMQYNTLLEQYQAGKKRYDKMGYIASISKRIGETELANEIAADYLHGHLNRLSEKELFNKHSFDFILSYSTILKSNDKIFKLLTKRAREVEQLMDWPKTYPEILIINVITREEISPKLWPNDKPIDATPDWESLTQTIGKKYDSYYTGLSVVYAQLKWYWQKKDLQQQIKYTVTKFENYGLDTAGLGWVFANNTVFDLFFPHCSNRDTLNKAIGWMDIILKGHPDDNVIMDTYANLLYKAGRREEAIEWQQKATMLEKQAAENQKRDVEPGYQETLDKMKKGIPTWPVN